MSYNDLPQSQHPFVINNIRAFSIPSRPANSPTLTEEEQKVLVKHIEKIDNIFKTEEDKLSLIGWEALSKTYDKLRQIEKQQFLSNSYILKYKDN